MNNVFNKISQPALCACVRACVRVCVCVWKWIGMYAYIPPSHLSHILNSMLIVSYVSSFFLLYLNLYLLTDSYPLDTTIYNLKQNRIPQLHPAWPPCFVLCIFLQFLRSSIWPVINICLTDLVVMLDCHAHPGWAQQKEWPKKTHILIFNILLVFLCKSYSFQVEEQSLVLDFQRSNELYKLIKFPHARRIHISICTIFYQYMFLILFISNLVLWRFIFLQLCGDIEVNPGPDSVEDSNSSSETLSNHLCIFHLNIYTKHCPKNRHNTKRIWRLWRPCLFWKLAKTKHNRGNYQNWLFSASIQDRQGRQ